MSNLPVLLVHVVDASCAKGEIGSHKKELLSGGHNDNGKIHLMMSDDINRKVVRALGLVTRRLRTGFI